MFLFTVSFLQGQIHVELFLPISKYDLWRVPFPRVINQLGAKIT